MLLLWWPKGGQNKTRNVMCSANNISCEAKKIRRYTDQKRNQRHRIGRVRPGRWGRRVRGVSDRTRRKGPRDAHGPSRVGDGRNRRFDAQRGGAFLVRLPREGIREAFLFGPLNKTSHASRPRPNAGECLYVPCYVLEVLRSLHVVVATT